MGGFKNSELNSIFYSNVFDEIVEKVLLCSEMMLEDCNQSGKSITNHEEKIRTHLLENYLENDEIRSKVGIDKLNLRFIVEAYENYDSSKESYIGRVDIKIVSSNWLNNRQDYYIIECKRIDGTNNLNKKFVEEGIARFVSEPTKYSSYRNKNFMFGFIVKDIDMKKNIAKINSIQKSIPGISIKTELLDLKSKIKNSYVYFSEYYVKRQELELRHLFYDFSRIVI